MEDANNQINLPENALEPIAAPNRKRSEKKEKVTRTPEQEAEKKAKKNLHDKHRQRMRERYIKGGLEPFADHEVLEFLLFYCYPQMNTNFKAHDMINEFGSLHNLFETDVQTIMQRCGVSVNIAVLVNLIPQLANRYFTGKWSRRMILNHYKVAAQYAIDLFVGRTNEAFYIFCLDAQRQLNHVSLIAEGTLDETAVYPREIINEAMKHQATAVILTHNHPGGTTKPSAKDMETTRKLVEGLAFINVVVLDHIIVAGDQYYSFAMRKQYVEGY